MVSAVVRSLQTWVSVPRFNASFAALCASGATSATWLLRSLYVISFQRRSRATLNRNRPPRNLWPHRFL